MKQFDKDVENTLFIVGAQTTPDGDMLPSSFSVFSVSTHPEDAIEVVVNKIMEDLDKAGIDQSVNPRGSLAFTAIETWEEWAELPIDPQVKLRALVGACTREFIETLVQCPRTVEVLTSARWADHDCSEHENL